MSFTPLVALAGVAALGGLINMPKLFGIPGGVSYELEHWLEPVIEFGEADITGTWAYDNKYVLVGFAVAAALIGVALAWLVYERKSIRWRGVSVFGIAKSPCRPWL